MDGTAQTQPGTLGLGLLILAIVVCFFAMGQSGRETGINHFDTQDKQWVAFPHDSGDIVYYVRVDMIIGVVEALDENIVNSGAFGRTEIMIAGGGRIRTDYTFDELEEVQEFNETSPSKTPMAARKAYLKKENGK